MPEPGPALERYSRVFGVESWRCYRFGSHVHRRAEYRGRPNEFASGLALSDRVPQFEHRMNPPPQGLNGLYAVTPPGNDWFTLYSGEKELEAYGLPKYKRSSGTGAKILLTPLAVAGDATLIGAVLGSLTAPATAAWRGYISHPMGFAFAAPGDLKVEKGTYRGTIAGARETIVYRFLDDDIEYKVEVIDMRSIRPLDTQSVVESIFFVIVTDAAFSIVFSVLKV